jgi:mRNA-degrading endonuclease YafQ of YafQ-DinJ toxin-antitoxin module
MQGGFKVAFTDRFKRDYKALPTDIRHQVDECIRDLAKDPIPTSRRAHCIDRASKPKIFSVDVTSNKAWKLSFQLEGQVATLRRVGTHKEIDRSS